MNWATIAPETRIYKGKNLFKWEDSPGLEHHCGTCATPLHNGRAKTSCIGKHVEPCYRYHQQLHFVGKSHECFGCNTSDEMHHNRHKDILRILRQISSLDKDGVDSIISQARSTGEVKGRRGSVTTASTGTTTDTTSESTGIEDVKQKRRERKKSKKTSNLSAKTRCLTESFPAEELDFVSEAIHLSVHESKGAWEGTYIYDHNQGNIENNVEIKDDHSSAAAAPEVHLITSSVDDLAVRSPMELTPRQRKTLKKLATHINHSDYGGGSHKFSPLALVQGVRDPYHGINSAIFFRLGVEVVNPVNNSKARKDLVAKLLSAITDDLEIIIREETEIDMRRAGFWRWAGKTAWHAMKETRQTIDWATGQKINQPPPKDLDDYRSADDPLHDILEEIKLLEVEKKEPARPQVPARPEVRVVVDDPSSTPWTIVESKNSSTQVMQKSTRYTKTSVATPDIKYPQDIVEEHGTEEFKEMVTRYQHQAAGARNIGIRALSPSLPDHRRGGRMVPKLI